MRHSCHDGIDEKKLFEPALWKQRRVFASHEIEDSGAATVLDVGCGEGSLLSILLNDCRYSSLAGIDIEQSSLDLCKINLSPTRYDQQFLREKPIILDLFQGDLINIDARLMGFDCITSLEVIEHLDADTLKEFPRVIFGVYNTPTVIISTPNADFNVNFPQLYNGKKTQQTFRHDDHKFEWTRLQFQKWCNEISLKYFYSVKFSGVGLIDGDSSNGYCSQIATFVRKNLFIAPNPLQENLSHFLTIEFPYFDEKFTDEELIQEIKIQSEYLFPLNYRAPDGEYLVVKVLEYWEVLRVRQVCGTFENLIRLLKMDTTLFKVSEDCEFVDLTFDWPKFEYPEIQSDVQDEDENDNQHHGAVYGGFGRDDPEPQEVLMSKAEIEAWNGNFMSSHKPDQDVEIHELELKQENTEVACGWHNVVDLRGNGCNKKIRRKIDEPPAMLYSPVQSAGW